jgi:hypothetical protein
MLQADKQSIDRAEGLGENWPSLQNPSFGATPFWRETHKSQQYQQRQTTPDQSRPGTTRPDQD